MSAGYSVSEPRLAAVLAVIAAGSVSINAIASVAGYSRSNVFNAVKLLLHRKQIELAGTRESNGGALTRLYRIVGAPPPLNAERLQKSQANGRRKHANAGIADLIRNALRGGASLTVEQIAIRTGKHPERVRAGLAPLIHITGGVVSEGPHREKRYRLFVPTERQDAPSEGRPYRKAGRITIPQYRWGSSRSG